MDSRFRLVHIRAFHIGLRASVKINTKAELRGGYRFEGRRSETNDQTIPTHVSHLGIVTWF
jgi:hypothetical protein